MGDWREGCLEVRSSSIIGIAEAGAPLFSRASCNVVDFLLGGGDCVIK